MTRWGSLARLLDRRREPCPAEGCTITGPHRHLSVPSLGDSASIEPPDPHRPIPGANAWPDDAVLVTYGELRRLVALHLDLARQGMPHAEPWAWVKLRAEAVRDGEAPLLLAEVLEG